MGTPGDTVAYSYTDSGWGDLLTSYDGTAITYDGIGNPAKLHGWSFTWEHGRQLASMSKSGATWKFTYNADGLRTKRAKGTSIVYNYVYNGGLLMQMTKGSDTLDFTYDANGMPLTVTHNGTTYYYATNLQGDIVAITDNTGATVVTYTYDAWGNILTTTDGSTTTLGTLNPLRYRRYVYDEETGLYYVSSRYYDPEIGRFINADGLISTGQGFVGNNMFAYCLNNPVMRYDPDGEIGLFTIGIIASALIGGVVSALSTAASGSSFGEVAASFAIGAVSGGAIAAVSGLFAASAISAGTAVASCSGIGVVTEAISIGVEYAFHHDDPGYNINWWKAGGRIVYAGGMGALSGAVSYGISKIFVGGDALIGTIISAEASVALGAVDFGVRQLMSIPANTQPSTSISPVITPSRVTSVTGKVVSDPYGAVQQPNISTISIIVRKPFYGHIR